MISEPKLEERAAQYYAAKRVAAPIPFGRYLQPAWDEVQRWLKANGIKKYGPAIIRYLTTDMSKKLDMDVGYIVDKALRGQSSIVADVLPAGRYVTLRYTGAYRGKGIFKANLAPLEWAKANQVVWNTTTKNGIEPWNRRAEVYLTDPKKETDPKKYKTELAFLVK